MIKYVNSCMRVGLICFCVVFCFSACKYVPFIKYQKKNGKTDLPSFGKYSYLAGSNNSFRAAYDVTRYDWHIKVNPDKKTIEGKMEIWMDMEASQDSLLVDLSHNFKIDSIVCKKALKYKRKRDIVYLIFSEDVQEGDQLEVTFYYHGKPPNIINEGPIVWKKDESDNPWFSTQTEGLGVGYLFPCKDLLIDEPEEVFMTIDVPEGLTTAANGTLIKEQIENQRNITTWHVDNSINVYNISFNVGDFTRFTLPYESINGNTYDLEFYVLKSNEEAGRKFYEQTPRVLKAAEELFGVYPWWNDGLKFVESTFSAMEHQGCIAMGDDYDLDWEDINTTLAHEIAHEWWGNSLTASDYSDIWLHEGLASYSEALIAEKLFGKEHYLKYCRNKVYWGIANKRPIQKVPNVRYTSWATYADQDIYPKGSMLMHTLRTQMENDDLFFSILKEAQVVFKDKVISSAQFEAFFLERCNAPFQPIFDVMLRQAEAPKLAYSVFLNDINSTAEIKFKWTESVPENYPMKILFMAGEEEIYLHPTHNVQSIQLPAHVDYKMQPWVSGYFVSAPLKE